MRELLKYEDFIYPYIRFFRVLTLEIGLKCPISCRHCYSECSPSRTEKMDEGFLITAIRQFARMENSQIVQLTGGEPFSYLDSLSMALEEIEQSNKLKSFIFTNGYWANSVTNARNTLDKLPKIDLIAISADIYHEQYIPLRFVRNALNACEESGASAFLSMCETSNEYLGRLKRELGEELFNATPKFNSALQPIGRAVNLDILRKPLQGDLLNEVCPLIGSPIILHDNTIIMCCGCIRRRNLINSYDSPFRFKTSSEISLFEIYNAAREDIIIQALRTLGIGYLLHLLKQTESYEVDISSYNHLCDLCIEIMTNPGLIDLLRQTIISRPSIMDAIKIKHSYYYGDGCNGIY